MSTDTKSAYLAWALLTATTLFWGGNFVVGRAVSADIPPIALAWWRWVLAMVVILPFAARGLWQTRGLLRQHWRYLLAVSVFSVACFNTFVYLGLQTLPATNAVLVLSSAPVMILGISWLLFREAVTLRQMIGLVVSLVGVVIIISEGQPTQLAAVLGGGAGNLWILVAVASWSLYSVLLRRRPAGINGTVFFALTVVIGWLCLTPFFVYEHFVAGRQMVFNAMSLLSIGYVGFFASVLAFLFWNQGVQMLGPNRASYFIHLIPVWGLILASLLLGERLLTFHWIGMVLIFGGIAFASFVRRAAAPKPA